MKLRALAKINLGLDVTGKREDGYHEVRMVMQTIQMYDQLEIKESKEPGIRLTTNLPFLPCNDGNLVYKAAKILMDEFDIRQGVDMNLTKFIPVAAGMAGGSSDAAAALVGINRMFQLGLTKRQLMERGVQIGADVPYCVMRGTALAEGIGEKLTSLPGVPMCYVLIGKPGINVSTKFVYGNLHLDEVTDHPDIDGMVQAIRNHDLYGITDRMGNVLESVTCPAYPVIDEIKAQMMKNGAVNAMMSGSGPTVFGIFDDPDKAEYNYVKDVDYISGAAILLSTALWKQIGGFDERFAPAYCEDSDLAFEVRKAGYRVVYQPKSKVIHFEGISNGTDVNGTGLKRYQVENSEKLKEKWKEEFKNQCVNNGNPNPFRARERSMGKKIIVVIDHYVPTFDKDAGSKTTFQYLKMFLKKGYVVKFIGDNYLHEEPYTSTLQQMGIEVLYGQEYLTGIWDWLGEKGKDIHVAYLNRPHIATKYVDFIKEHTDIKMIYYGHDLHFMREFREYELTGDVKKRQESEYWKSIEFSLFHKVAVSYYPSYVEEEAIHAVDETISVKAITAYVYEEFLQNLNKDFAKREGLLFVGGFAHPPNADAVLWFAKEVFPKIREQIKVNFYIVGSKVTDEIKALEQPGNGIIVKGFVSEEELADLYRNCRIVVVPLRYGAGVKGKVVEAIYNGAPIVTTSVGSEGIPDVEKVLLVKDQPDEFAETVVELYKDEKRLEDLAEKTQVYIREHFSIDAAWDVIKEDFE